VTNYNEQSATATTLPYRRVRALVIRNPPTGLPIVEILEADAVVLNGSKIHISESNGMGVTIDAATLAETFPLRNPADDQPLGANGSGAQLMALIYSWARFQQGKRDAAAVPN
jgi:hypothetical protein